MVDTANWQVKPEVLRDLTAEAQRRGDKIMAIMGRKYSPGDQFFRLDTNADCAKPAAFMARGISGFPMKVRARTNPVR